MKLSKEISHFKLGMECVKLSRVVNFSPFVAGEFPSAFKKKNSVCQTKISRQLLQIIWRFENFTFDLQLKRK